MSDINPSALGEKLDPAFEEAIKNASSTEQLKALLADRTVSAGLATRDRYSPDVLIPTGAATAPTPTRFGKTVEIAGKKLIFEGDSELEVERAIGDYFRALQPAETTEPARQPRNEAGQFTRSDDPVAKAELDLKFKRGEIDTATYLAESGAFDQYLASQGISLNDVKKVAEQSYVADWKSATNQFLETHPEWKGGAPNRDEIGRTLQSLGLDGKPSVESLEAAYADMLRRNAVHENPEVTAQQELHSRFANARDFSEIKSIGSSLFGRR
jgi:hypothetical protein